MKLVLAFVDERGKDIAEKIRRSWSEPLPLFKLRKFAENSEKTSFQPSLKEVIEQLFSDYEGVILFLSSEFIQKNQSQLMISSIPLLVAVDETSQKIICLTGGMQPQEDVIINKIAELLNAKSIFHHANTLEQTISLDQLAKNVRGWYSKERHDANWFDGLIKENKPVGIVQEEGEIQAYPGLTPIDASANLANFAAVVWISSKAELITNKKIIQIVPRKFYLGLACQRELHPNFLRREFLKFCHQEKIHPFSVRRIGCLEELHGDEAIIDFAAWLQVSVKTYGQEVTGLKKNPDSAKEKKRNNYGSLAAEICRQFEVAGTISPVYENNDVGFALKRPLVE